MGCADSTEPGPGSAIDPDEEAAYEEASEIRQRQANDSGGEEDSEPGIIGRRVSLAFKIYEAEKAIDEYDAQEAERNRVQQAELQLRIKYLQQLGVSEEYLAGEEADRSGAASPDSTTARGYCTPAKKSRIEEWVAEVAAANVAATPPAVDETSSLSPSTVQPPTVRGSPRGARAADDAAAASGCAGSQEMPSFLPIEQMSPSPQQSPQMRSAADPSSLGNTSFATGTPGASLGPGAWGMSVSGAEDLSGSSPQLPGFLQPAGTPVSSPVGSPKRQSLALTGNMTPPPSSDDGGRASPKLTQSALVQAAAFRQVSPVTTPAGSPTPGTPMQRHGSGVRLQASTSLVEPVEMEPRSPSPPVREDTDALANDLAPPSPTAAAQPGKSPMDPDLPPPRAATPNPDDSFHRHHPHAVLDSSV